ncbi:hypothetical protein FRC10_008020 [Ceratobasidium sp. 414]|nr:hypothetical protein FRC10_008020 [Ceratobasidium sp. 414]
MSIAILSVPTSHLPSHHPIYPPLPSPPRPPRVSSVYSIRLVDLLLAAHSQVTKREIDFTILMLDAIIHASNPHGHIPTYLLDRALDAPDLVHALAASPHLDLGVGGEGRIGHVFTHLIRHVALRYCYREHMFTPGSYREVIEYLTLRPLELAAKHKQYRADVARLEQAAHAAVKARKRKNRGQAAAMVVLSIFMTKKEWQEARKKVRTYIVGELR